MNLPFVIIAGTLGMMILAGSIIMFAVLYQKRITLHQLNMKEIDLAHQRELLHSTLETQEIERKRLSGDLHDEVGALLATLRITLSRLPNAEQGKQQEVLNESRILVDAISSSARRISHALTPPGLEIFGITASLEELLTPIENSGIEIFFRSELGENNPDQRTALVIYRIVQELISNTLKHSGAKKISLALLQNPSHYILSYSDNGSGYDRSARKGKGMGLKNIESRISLVKGKIEYPYTISGMSVEISIPKQDGKS